MKVINGILLVLIVVMLWTRWFGTGGSNELNEKQLMYTKQLDKNKISKAQNEKLRAEVDDLNNGLEAIEERARSEMGMVKDGEVFIQVIEDNSSQ